MSIIIDENTKIVVQGITGKEGRFHTNEMIKFGSRVVAGVTPGKGKESVHGIPVYNSIEESMEKEPNATMITVPAQFVKDAAFEALDSGISLIYILTEHVPFHDTVEILHHVKRKRGYLIGPNSPGITTPFESKIGIMPNNIFKKGNIGVIARSGTLTYEIVYALTKNGFGQSTVIGLGGDPIVGLSFIDVLERFKYDDDTEAVVLVGEIGGSSEEDAATYIEKHFDKPVVAYIAGKSAPPSKGMGHAGAIITGKKGTATSKIAALKNSDGTGQDGLSAETNSGSL